MREINSTSMVICSVILNESIRLSSAFLYWRVIIASRSKCHVRYVPMPPGNKPIFSLIALSVNFLPNKASKTRISISVKGGAQQALSALFLVC